jgi:recombination protein RecT
VIGVASVGLSLNPHKQLAYLVPRKGEVCLDVSWRGFIQQALDLNSITSAAVELRYKNDHFEFQGAFQAPIHKFDPDDERGALRGGYCVARLSNSDVLVTYMTIEEINGIRDRTESWKSFKSKGSSTPWSTDFNEMAKKTIIRRAWKMWPKKDLAAASALDEIEDRTNPILLAPAPSPSDDIETQQLLLNIRTALDILEKSEATYVEYLKAINHRSDDLKRLEDLTKSEMRAAKIALDQLVDKKTAREQKT